MPRAAACDPLTSAQKRVAKAWLDQRRRTRIVVYTPADKPTKRRLERLHRSLV